MSIKSIKKQLPGLIFLLLICSSMPLDASDSGPYYVPSGQSSYGLEHRLVWNHGGPIINARLAWSLSPNNGTATLSYSSTTGDDGRIWFLLTFGENACGTYTVRLRLNGDPRPSSFLGYKIVYAPCPTVPSSGTTSPPPAPKLEKISDDNQVTAPGDSLMLIVELQDSDGSPMPDVDLSFSILSGDESSASLSPGTATTDANGRAQTTLTLGTDASGEYIVKAYPSDNSAIYTEFTVTVDSSLPKATRLEKISGDNQTGLTGGVLPNPFVVKVGDQYDAPLVGATVTFTVLTGDGTLSHSTSTTNAAGQASATLMFGDSPGEVAVEVSVAEIYETVVFTATATLFPLDAVYIDAIEPKSNPYDSRTNKVFGVAFSPDGTMLASAHSDNTVRLWEVESRELKHTLPGHKYPVRCVEFSPDGKTVASGSQDTTVRFWDSDTGELKHVVSTYTGSVWDVAVSPDGNTLASATEWGYVHVWDVKNLSRIRRKHRIRAHSTRAWNVAFSPDGNILASVGGDEIVRLWNPETGEMTKALEGHEEQVLSVAFGGDNTLASGSADGSVRMWNLETESSRVLAGHTGWVFSVGFHPNGEILASTGKDNSVRLWDAAAGTPLHVLERHTKWGRSVAISRDGILASGGYDNMIHLWDLGVKLDAIVEAMEVVVEGTEREETAPQQSVELLPNFPNPLNPETWIPYHLSKHADVQISIYDSKGELVRRLDLGHQAAGYYRDRTQAAYWDGRNESGEQVASGLYFYRLSAGDYSAMRKMLILK